MKIINTFIVCLLCASVQLLASAQDFDPILASDTSVSISAYPNGDLIPDYSYCGYMAGEEALPDILLDSSVPVVRIAEGNGSDQTSLIQAAIDYAATLPIGESGFRAVVLVSNGIHNISGSLKISDSGIVLRGEGPKTILRASGISRETLITIAGEPDIFDTASPAELACSYLPVNSSLIPLKPGHSFKTGDFVRIVRPSTAEWIKHIGGDKIGLYADYNMPAWKAGDFDLAFDRTITEVSESSISIDVPLPQSFDEKFGGAIVTKAISKGRISKVAIENLSLESEYEESYPKDEDHRWMAISIDNAQDCWVRRVTAKHFVSSAVYVLAGGRRITVEECKSLEPVGEIGGYRRLSFQTYGQQTLFLRCFSEEGYHDFAVGASSAGPNAFVLCYAANSHGFSGALGGWSCGTLFDRVTVENNPIKFSYLDLDLQGGGWSSANSMCWQCRAPQIHLGNPPDAHNWAYGSRGQGYGDGSHAQSKLIRPEYFYYVQYALRKGAIPEGEAEKLIYYNPEFSSTDAAFALAQSLIAKEPAWTTERWIDTLCVRFPLASTLGNNAQRIVDASNLKIAPASDNTERHTLVEKGGVISMDGQYLAGRSTRTALWKGTTRPSAVREAGVHLTRFVPGRTGLGFTDDLNSIPEILKSRGVVTLQHFPALWYERRRDDHGRMTRADADVWAPFYEQPYARSGEGESSIRLSLYDLNRWNKWYWDRISSFADIAERSGLVFVHEHYLQHNIIEEGAHWIDYPWRSANNINDLGLTEPTYMQGDKRVFMASQFYDLGNEKLKNYHRRYIRKSLDEIKGKTNVINHIGVEYTGPADFMKFWLQTIQDWEKENGVDVKVALNATRDVTEAVLADENLASEVDIIDIRQWYYCKNDYVYDPQGGVSLAPRQYARVMDPGQTDLSCVWKIVREYRSRFPEKAVWLNNAQVRGKDWVAFLAGASLCQIPRTIEASGFYSNALKMKSLDDDACSGSTWAMGAPGTGYIVYSTDMTYSIDLSGDKSSYKLVWLDSLTGKTLSKPARIKGGSNLSLTSPVASAVAYLYK